MTDSSPSRDTASNPRATHASRNAEGVFPPHVSRPPRPPRERPDITLRSLPLKPIFAIVMLAASVLGAGVGYSVYSNSDCADLDAQSNQVFSQDGLLGLSVAGSNFKGRFGARITDATPQSMADAATLEAAANRAGTQLVPVGNVYRIKTCFNKPIGSVLQMILPVSLTTAQAGFQLDLYTWESAAREWRWLGGEANFAQRMMRLETSSIPDNVVLMRSVAARTVLMLEVLPDSRLSADYVGAADRLSAVGLYLGEGGGVVGHPSRLFNSLEAFAKRVPAVRNWNLRGEVNRTLLSELLAKEANMRSHAGNLASLVSLGNMPGLELDYRGVMPQQSARFVELVTLLDAALAEQGKWLSIGVPAPNRNASGLWSLSGYDLAAIGRIADEVKIDLAASPQALASDELESLIVWVLARVPRGKVVLVAPMSSLSVSSLGDVSHISIAEASEAFGVAEGGPAQGQNVKPGERISFTLRNRFDKGSLRFDTESQSYRFSFNDFAGVNRTVWVNNSAALARLAERLLRSNVKGVAFRGLEPELSDSAVRSVLRNTLTRQPAAPQAQNMRLTWSITAPDTTVRTTLGRLTDTVFIWEVPPIAGEYRVNAALEGADRNALSPGLPVRVDAVAGADSSALIAGSAVVSSVLQPISGITSTARVITLAAGTELVLPPPWMPAGDEGKFELGGAVSGPASFERALGSGMTWVRLAVKDFGDPSAFVSAAHAKGLKVLISAVGEKSRVLDDDYQAKWVSHLAGIAASGADAIEVWNQPNVAAEWPSEQIGAASYVKLLARAFNAIKQRNPATLVISAALAPTGAFNNACGSSGCDDSVYLAEMAQLNAADYADCIGVQYTSGTVAPTQNAGAATGGHPSWYYAPMREQYSSVFASARKVCFTSLGYLAADGFGPLPQRYAWAGTNSVTSQAQWLAQAAALSANSSKVRLMIVWNIDLNSWNFERGDVRGGYAIVRPNGTCPACDSLRAAMAPR